MSRPHIDDYKDLTVGDTVHFVEYIHDGLPKCWPAIIVKKLSDKVPILKLQVITEHGAGYLVEKVTHDGNPTEPIHGTWHVKCCCRIGTGFSDHIIYDDEARYK